MEKVVHRGKLRDFKVKGSAWKNRTYEERLTAVAVISGAQEVEEGGKIKPGFSRVYKITRKNNKK